MGKNSISILALAMGVAFSSAAYADINATLTFRDPTGTVSPNDTIDIWVTLALDPASDSLVFDSSLGAPFGLDPAVLPTTAYRWQIQDYVPFASYTSIQTNVGYGCDGTFSNLCGQGGPYQFTWNAIGFPGYDPSTSFYGLTTFNLQPGESRDYLFGRLTPTGTVTPGDYTAGGASFSFDVYGLDADGNELNNYLQIGSETYLSGSTFTRTVTAVPESDTYALMLAGLGLVGLMVRRRG